MSFEKTLKLFKELKGDTEKQKVSSITSYDELVMKVIPSYLKEFIDGDKLFVRPSVGQGMYADIPWICILSTNAKISPTPQKGIYIVLLFTKEGTGFYLTLMQGITNFKEMKIAPAERKRRIENTVNYFQSEIDNSLIEKHGFTKATINLGENISSLANAYTKTTIISKHFHNNSFNEKDFYKSLAVLIKEYMDIVEHIGDKSYDDVLELIDPSYDFEKVDDAIEKITETIGDLVDVPRDITPSPVLVKKGTKRSNKYRRISQPRIYKKIDYIKKTQEQHKNGLLGEKLALSIERKRLSELGLDPNNYLKWSNEISDSYGYDFETHDYIDGKLTKIFVEVKATKDQTDTDFFVSKNEVNVSLLKKNLYRVFRIFDLNSLNPKYYLADGPIEDNFYLDPVTFSAKYKYNVEV